MESRNTSFFINRIHASGKSNYTLELVKILSQKKKEILASENLSEEEKKAKIISLEKSYNWKIKLSKYCNF